MKIKNIIPNISFLFMILLALSAKTGQAQSASDFVLIEPTSTDYEQLQQKYGANSRVYFNRPGKPALYVYGQMAPTDLVNNLFIYTPTTPGTLKFASGEINAGNIDEFATDLSQLTKSVKGSLIIHSTDVFSGASGTALKSKLEALCGVTVTMSVNIEPFSN
ncbi:DUF4347 domain-containing protein [Draconibacterium orientale]|uniref:DUF4347 domain-containing protein n=1 Tax=Draconibacterium orientale TaxID=1168034 RepID=UPI0029C06612|nr:DUF4347 domain-containing protein [Draconibacterium orientale]